MRKLEWLVLVWYHWDPDQKMFGGFRDYLEMEAVPYAVQRRKDDEAEQLKRKRDLDDEGKKTRKAMETLTKKMRRVRTLEMRRKPT